MIPPLLKPHHLTPAQMNLHLQLQSKTRDLRAKIERQQADLIELIRQLNLAAAPTSMGLLPSQVAVYCLAF